MPATRSDSSNFVHTGAAVLGTADMTDSESENLRVALINSEFTHVRDELRTIRDPWLTIDEIHSEGLGRFEKIRAAEQRRRESLEELTSQPWSRVDFEHGWSKTEIFLNLSAVLAGLRGEAAYQVNALIAEGAREVGLARSNPFDVSTPTLKQEVHQIVLRQEAKMRESLDDEQFHKFFTPWVLMTMEDVRSLKGRFGREATDEERDAIAAYLMPEHPLAEIIGEQTVPEGHFSKELLLILRPVIGDETFAHLLDYQKQHANSDGFDWEPTTRLQVFDLETSRDRAGLEALLSDEDLAAYKALQRGAWMSEPEGNAE